MGLVIRSGAQPARVSWNPALPIADDFTAGAIVVAGGYRSVPEISWDFITTDKARNAVRWVMSTEEADLDGVGTG